MATVLKAVRIVDACNEDFGGSWSDAGDRLDSRNAWIFLADGFEFLGDHGNLRGKCIELREFDVKFTFPKIVCGAIDQWLADGVDTLASRVPSFIARVNRDAMIDEPSTYGAFHLVDAVVERFAVLDQGPKLAMLLAGHMDGFEFVHRCHASKFECVVFV